MSVIDKVKKHFNDQSSKTITVEEWDATFVVRPMNLDEVRRFLEKQKQNSIEAVVDLMIMKLLKELILKKNDRKLLAKLLAEKGYELVEIEHGGKHC